MKISTTTAKAGPTHFTSTGDEAGKTADSSHFLIPVSWRRTLAIFRVGAAVYALTVASQAAGLALASTYLVLAAGALWVATAEWERLELVVLGADAGFMLVASASDNFFLFLWCLGILTAHVITVTIHKRRLIAWADRFQRTASGYRADALSARGTERERIAQDFHDGPMQVFTSFQMRLEVLHKILERDPAGAGAELGEFQKSVKSQVAGMREFMERIRDGGAGDQESGFFTAVAGLIHVFERDTGIAVTFQQTGDETRVSGALSIEALHILREALHNVYKHAGSTTASVSAMIDQELSLHVEDNGRGFPFRGAYRLDELDSMHMGPESIKKRVRTRSGNLMLESRPGQGSRLLVSLPL